MFVRFYQARQVYAQLPMKAVSVLPDEGMPAAPLRISDQLPLFAVHVNPKPAPGVRWGHRVMVHCTCGREIPFGRMCQHWGTHS